MFHDADILARLLELWRETRDPEVAQLIDQFRPESSPFRSWMKSYERWWRCKVVLARCDPRELSELLREADLSDETLAALEAWPDDPRIATWIVGRAASWWGPQIARACALLRRLADRRTIQASRDAGPPWSDVAQEIERAPWKVAERSAILVDIAARTTARADHARELAARLGRIYDAPADLVERSVLADWLIERGDPRGELIALQLAPPTRAGRVRARELLARHADEWLDDIYVSGFRRAFRHGFLDRCSVDVRRIRAESIGRAWATVRHVELRHDGWRDRTFAPVLPALVSLYTLEGPAAETLAALARGACPQLRRLHVAAGLVHALARKDRELPGVPRLRHLTTAIDPGSWIVGSPLWRRCEIVSIFGRAHHLGDWLAVLQRSPHLRSLRFEVQGWDQQPRFRITPHGRLQITKTAGRQRYPDFQDALRAALQSLPARTFPIVECANDLRGWSGIADELARIAR